MSLLIFLMGFLIVAALFAAAIERKKNMKTQKEKEKEESCECGLMENGTWSEELFDKFGCTCD